MLSADPRPIEKVAKLTVIIAGTRLTTLTTNNTGLMSLHMGVSTADIMRHVSIMRSLQ